MAPITLYTASVPLFKRQLLALRACLDKAEAHAQARRFDSANYLGLRLAPDMLPLAAQVRIACDTAKGAVYRLAGLDVPAVADDETTLAQLVARIDRTLALVEAVPADAIAGSESREVLLPMRNRDPLRFDGLGYLQTFVLPNFYFHVTTTYALLRHAGVELGKRDFLGAE